MLNAMKILFCSNFNTFNLNPSVNIENSEYNGKIILFKDNRIEIKFSKQIIERLSAPYETNCRHYGQKTRDHCLTLQQYPKKILTYGILKNKLSQLKTTVFLMFCELYNQL